MRETQAFYFFWRHQFGQWTLRDMMDIDGITYNCCEQYMMYKKACLFDDQVVAQRILNEPSPQAQQQLGRTVNNFNRDLWDTNKLAVVWQGNFLKFSQHPDLHDRLLATEDKIIAEASAEDLVWGVGLKADDDAILNPNNWTGKNLLGEVLMSVRATLRLQRRN